MPLVMLMWHIDVMIMEVGLSNTRLFVQHYTAWRPRPWQRVNGSDYAMSTSHPCHQMDRLHYEWVREIHYWFGWHKGHYTVLETRSYHMSCGTTTSRCSSLNSRQRQHSTEPSLEVSTRLTMHHVASSSMHRHRICSYILAQGMTEWRAPWPVGYVSDDDGNGCAPCHEPWPEVHLHVTLLLRSSLVSVGYGSAVYCTWMLAHW